MAFQTPESTRRPPNLSKEALRVAKVRAALAGVTMKVWIGEAILEKAAREEVAEQSSNSSKKLIHA